MLSWLEFPDTGSFSWLEKLLFGSQLRRLDVRAFILILPLSVHFRELVELSILLHPSIEKLKKRN